MRGNTSHPNLPIDYDVVSRTNGRVPAAAAAALSGRPRRGFYPKTYLGYAILSLLGAWPLAVVAIMQANRVTSKWDAGDKAGAYKASERARQWATASWVVGALMIFMLLTAG